MAITVNWTVCLLQTSR